MTCRVTSRRITTLRSDRTCAINHLVPPSRLIRSIPFHIARYHIGSRGWFEEKANLTVLCYVSHSVLFYHGVSSCVVVCPVSISGLRIALHCTVENAVAF